MRLDARDLDILRVLADEGRITKADLATRVGLSATISPLEEIARFLVGRRYGRAHRQGSPDCLTDHATKRHGARKCNPTRYSALALI